MPRFLSDRDVAYFKSINKEMVDRVIESPVIIYKLEMRDSPTNIYGEAPKKSYHVGVQVTCLINRQDNQPVSEGHVLDVSQAATYAFLRETLQEKGVYPEAGDIIEYDSSFWEIDNVNENQLLGSQPFLNFAIICVTHLTKKSTLQIVQRQQIPNNLE